MDTPPRLAPLGRAAPKSSLGTHTPAVTDPAMLLEENRQLQIELEALRAEKYARREREIARLALSDRTLLVTEHELPHYVPFTVRQIKRMRTDGRLPFIRDPMGRKSKFLYNLRDVEATLLAGEPKKGPLVRTVDWDKIRVSA